MTLMGKSFVQGAGKQLENGYRQRTCKSVTFILLA